jgi:hypothetical protein
MGMQGVWARTVEPFVRPGFLPGRRLEPAASARPPAAEVEPALLVAPAGAGGPGC